MLNRNSIVVLLLSLATPCCAEKIEPPFSVFGASSDLRQIVLDKSVIAQLFREKSVRIEWGYLLRNLERPQGISDYVKSGTQLSTIFEQIKLVQKQFSQPALVMIFTTDKIYKINEREKYDDLKLKPGDVVIVMWEPSFPGF